jgi:hypothetical protein
MHLGERPVSEREARRLVKGGDVGVDKVGCGAGVHCAFWKLRQGDRRSRICMRR